MAPRRKLTAEETAARIERCRQTLRRALAALRAGRATKADIRTAACRLCRECAAFDINATGP